MHLLKFKWQPSNAHFYNNNSDILLCSLKSLDEVQIGVLSSFSTNRNEREIQREQFASRLSSLVAMPEQSSRRTELAGENAMPSPACFVRLLIDFALVATHGEAEIEPINYQRF